MTLRADGRPWASAVARTTAPGSFGAISSQLASQRSICSMGSGARSPTSRGVVSYSCRSASRSTTAMVARGADGAGAMGSAGALGDPDHAVDGVLERFEPLRLLEVAGTQPHDCLLDDGFEEPGDHEDRLTRAAP